MKKTHSSINRTLNPSDAKRQEALSQKVLNQKKENLQNFDLEDPVIQNLKKTNPLAYALQLCVQGILGGINNDRPDLIEISRTKLLTYTATLTALSLHPDYRLTQDEMSNFYAIAEVIHVNVAIWKQSGRQDWLLRIYQYNLQNLLTEIVDSIAVAMAIAAKRVVFINKEFAITYGVNRLDPRKVLRGELFASVFDSNGLWSLDKDDAVRIKLTTLRAAKRAVDKWRGANLVGEVTHNEAQRIADFFGLVPVPNSKRKLVMLVGNNKSPKGFKS